jgi:hypothetical protein
MNDAEHHWNVDWSGLAADRVFARLERGQDLKKAKRFYQHYARDALIAGGWMCVGIGVIGVFGIWWFVTLFGVGALLHAWGMK